jgi:hypothetical protein
MEVETVRILLIGIIAMGLAFYVRAYFTKKAVLKVVEIFYQHNALTAKNAKTREELGLVPYGLLQRLSRPRDYKQPALQVLMQRGLIAMTEEGKLYLDEGQLDPSLRSKGHELRSTGK